MSRFASVSSTTRIRRRAGFAWGRLATLGTPATLGATGGPGAPAVSAPPAGSGTGPRSGISARPGAAGGVVDPNVLNGEGSGVGERGAPDGAGSDGRTSASILSSSRAISTGLISYSSHPPSSALGRSIAWSPSAMTGIDRVRSDALMRRVAAQPSRTGRSRSMRMRSGAASPASATARCPSAAVRTSYPTRCSRRASAPRFTSFSSTRRIFAMGHGPCCLRPVLATVRGKPAAAATTHALFITSPSSVLL
jgi:hypothetical protein